MARVVLTAPEPRASQLAAALAARGHETLRLAFSKLESLASTPAVAAVLADLAGFDRIVFVSPAAIDVVVEALGGAWPDRAAPAVVGPGSREALARHGLEAHPGLLVPPGPDFDGAALLALPALAAPLTGRILVVRAEGGNTMIERELARRGAEVRALEAYRRRTIEPPPAALARLAAWLDEHSGQDTQLLVTTVEAADRLGALADRGTSLGSLRRLRTLAIHPRIVERLASVGWRNVVQILPGLEALRRAIESGNEGCGSAGVPSHSSGTERD